MQHGSLTSQMLPVIISAQFFAAVVAALVSILATTLTYRQKARELTLTYRQALDDLRARIRELEQRFEALRQEQLAEIVKRRADTYPKLYGIIAEYGRNWELKGKHRDRQWAQLFLDALLANNAANGVFFSNQVYREYGRLRDHLADILRTASPGATASKEQINAMYDIIRGAIQADGSQAPGLGSYLKNDLGSYVEFASSALYGHLKPQRGASPDAT